MAPSQNDEGTRWAVTVNLPDGEAEEYLQRAVDDIAGLYNDGHLKYAVGSFERGENTNRLHLQAFLICVEKHRAVWISGRITGSYVEVRAYSKKNDLNNRNYCCNPSKLGYVSLAFEHGPWPLVNDEGKRTDTKQLMSDLRDCKFRTIDDVALCYPGIVFREKKKIETWMRYYHNNRRLQEYRLARNRDNPFVEKVWQFWLRRYLLETKPDDRRIIFICDLIGRSGKSRFIDDFSLTSGKACQDLTPGKLGDMADALDVSSMDVLFIDITRSKNEHVEYVYDFVENIKSGKLFAPKFESAMLHFPPPHVVIFSNMEIDLGGEDKTKLEWSVEAQMMVPRIRPMPLTYDRYVWWDLSQNHRMDWSVNHPKWGRKFPPFKTLAGTLYCNPRFERDMYKVVPYTPPGISTSGPEFSSDEAGDGPESRMIRFAPFHYEYWCMKSGRWILRDMDEVVSAYRCKSSKDDRRKKLWYIVHLRPYSDWDLSQSTKVLSPVWELLGERPSWRPLFPKRDEPYGNMLLWRQPEP